TDEDVIELAFSHFNLHGIDKLVDFVLSWKPQGVIYRISQKFFRRLIDANNFTPIEEASRIVFRKKNTGSPYLVLALTNELLRVGRFPSQYATQKCLNLLSSKQTRIAKPTYPDNHILLSAILSFLEACVANKH